MMNEKWVELSHSAILVVEKGQPIDTFQSHIQILFEPSFDDALFFQLNWTESTVRWYKTTWLKSVDSFKFDPIENLKYIGKDIKPTIEYNRGEMDISKIKNIIELVQKISIAPRIQKYGAITLDGCYYTLTIGVERFETIYKWHSLSEEWQVLQSVADMLYNLALSSLFEV